MAKGNPTEADVLKALKRLGSADELPSEREIADELGIKVSQVGKIVWPLEHKAFPALAIKGTGANIAKARKSGVRWEKIALRSGMTVPAVKKLYEEHTGEDASASYTGRGRKTFENGGGGSSSGKASGGRRTAGRSAGTSGRRAAAKGATAGRRGAGRRQRAADPS